MSGYSIGRMAFALLLAGSLSAADWPVLRTYEGESLRRVKMPLGGIGTGTISLSGRGSLVDWELRGHPDKGFTPGSYKLWAPHFAIRCETADGRKVARLLEGPILPEEFEGWEGCKLVNHGFPRFARAVFRAAYPLAQVELADERMPVRVTLEAMNPLVPGDVSASGIPAVLLRWRIRNPLDEPVEVSVCGSIVDIDGVELWLGVPEGLGRQTAANEVREPGWNVSSDRYWRRFVETGDVADSDPSEPNRCPVRQRCVAVSIPSGGERAIPFVLGWRSPKRMAWDSADPADDVGSFAAVEYASAESAARRLMRELPDLEEKTLAFVRGILAGSAPDAVKEAALFNLSTLRSETCFRTADGHFFAWEGCRDTCGSCAGSCTHVWGYEHALVDLWPDLARDMLDLQFGPALDPRTGHMAFRIGLPLAAAEAMSVAADDPAFAGTCRTLRTRGAAWTERNLFNGAYYEHRIVPPKGRVADGLRHPSMGARNPDDPDYQLGRGCLIDQLLGDYAARLAGLGPVADADHARTALATVVSRCARAADDEAFNPMRSYVMAGERSLRMAWYPDGGMPRSPFPYYRETMTGFEYVVAALQVMYGDRAGAERTVRDIRDRYDGRKRNPFDEAECGHHYARALAAWSVLKAWEAKRD